jgi:hypothetical protein
MKDLKTTPNIPSKRITPFSMKRMKGNKIVRYCYWILWNEKHIMTLFNNTETKNVVTALNNAYRAGMISAVLEINRNNKK